MRRHSSLRTMFLEFQPTDASKTPLIQVVVKESFDMGSTACFSHADPVTTLEKQQPMLQPGTLSPHFISVCYSEDGRVFLKLEISHIVVDGASMSVLLRDLGLAYEGKLSSMQGPPLYRDYVAYLENTNRTLAVEYWSAYLANLTPTFFPVLSDNGAVEELQALRVELTRSSELAAFCQRSNITLATLFQAAWGLVLSCFTSQQDICFGFLASGRDIPINGIDDAVGLFINLLICRCNLDPQLLLQEVLESVQADFVNSLPHQHCSLAEIQHALSLPASNSVFNTIMSFQRKSVEVSEAAALEFEMIVGEDPTEVSHDQNSSIVHFLTRGSTISRSTSK